MKGILEAGGVGQVCPDVDKELWRLGPDGSVCFGVLCANRTREVKRDFCNLPIRRGEGRVVNTPLVVKKGSFSGDEKKRERGEEKGQESPGERTDGKEREETERESGRERVNPALNGEKG
ncbi:hypothetical protein TNCV_1016351 [Trichonephila clavipes]|uniref:Uncharacterized protein n=1 Tax=Trichonephila clavipes TaxID=2585209 RepID=A0A8X7BBC5_TRICX|nr:hypothetical protein TNCV_1016351 [Trichonephila clavipes]